MRTAQWTICRFLDPLLETAPVVDMFAGQLRDVVCEKGIRGKVLTADLLSDVDGFYTAQLHGRLGLVPGNMVAERFHVQSRPLRGIRLK